MPYAPRSLVVKNPLNGDHMVLMWSPSIDPKTGTPDNNVIGYNVYRGLSDNDDKFIKVNEFPVGITDFTDQVRQKIRTEYWYKVTAVAADGSESASIGPTTYRKSDIGRLKYVLAEIERRQARILSNDGQYVHLLVRRTVGERCPNYDVRRGQHNANVASCPFCYGTSYKGGYMLSPNILMRVIRSQERIDLGEAGLAIVNVQRGWLGKYPIIHARDVLITNDNQRFELGAITPITGIAGVITRQEFAMTELELSHPIYSYDVPELDIK